MSYYKVLGFAREPFSTSPDPEFFYESKEHEAERRVQGEQYLREFFERAR